MDIKIYQPDDGQPIPDNVKDITFFDVNKGLQEIDKETIVVGRTYSDIHLMKQYNPAMVCGILVLEGDKIPEEWTAKGNMIDLIFASSEYNKKMLEQNGIAINTEIVHHGFNPEIFKPSTDAINHINNEPIKLLFVAGHADINDRKGGQFLAEAFNVFSKDDIELIYKINTSYNPAFNAEAHLRSLIKPELQDKVTFITKYMDDNELADLYRSCDVYVLPSMGEAFCQSALEALACGIPVIATDYSGYLDYCVPSGGFIPIKIKKRVIARYGIFDVPSGSVWVEPDIGHLKEILRNLNKEDLSIMGKKASEYVHANLTWKRMGERTMSVIQKNLHD